MCLTGPVHVQDKTDVLYYNAFANLAFLIPIRWKRTHVNMKTDKLNSSVHLDDNISSCTYVSRLHLSNADAHHIQALNLLVSAVCDE